jgi:transposase
LWIASSSPGLSARVSFYGLYFYNEGWVRLWPYARANSKHTIDVLRRLRAEVPDRKLILLWDGAPYHRARAVRATASDLGITLVPLPGYSPDLMPVEALWRWLREDVTYHHCHTSPDDLTRRVAAFETRLNQNPFAVADRLWVKDQLDPDEEKLVFQIRRGLAAPGPQDRVRPASMKWAALKGRAISPWSTTCRRPGPTTVISGGSRKSAKARCRSNSSTPSRRSARIRKASQQPSSLQSKTMLSVVNCGPLKS